MSTAGRLVYRPVTGRVLTGCYVAFAAWWILAGLTSDGRAGLSVTAFAWMVLIGTAMYALLWRPAVIVDPDGVRLVNVVRDITIPWGALEGIETRYALTLVTADRSYASWGAGAPGRGSAAARTVHRRVTGARAAEAAAAADARHLPRQGWLPGEHTPDRSSRDLRTDSGAAAFMVEQAWVGWRERPRAAAKPGTGPSTEPGSKPGTKPGTEVPAVDVRWNAPVIAAVLGPLVVALIAGALHA